MIYRNKHIDTVNFFDANGNEFVGTGKHYYPGREFDATTFAVYGWSKNGTTFNVYQIGHGHIEKIGTIRRVDLDVLMATA